MDTSAPPQKFETLRHQTHGAEMSWVRSVLCPKCPYTINCLSPLQNFWIRYWSAPPYLSQMHIMNYTRFNTGKSELLQTIIRPIGRGAPTAPSPPLWIRLLLHHLPEADDAEQAKDNAKLYEYLSASFLQPSSFSIAKTRDSAVFSDVVTQIVFYSILRISTRIVSLRCSWDDRRMSRYSWRSMSLPLVNHCPVPRVWSSWPLGAVNGPLLLLVNTQQWTELALSIGLHSSNVLGAYIQYKMAETVTKVLKSKTNKTRYRISYIRWKNMWHAFFNSIQFILFQATWSIKHTEDTRR